MGCHQTPLKLILKEYKFNQEKIILVLQDIFDDLFLDEVLVTPELTAQDVPEWDSLFHISLILEIESKFHIKFKMGEVEQAENIGKLAALIYKKI